MGIEFRNREAARKRHLSQCHPGLFRNEPPRLPNVAVRTGRSQRWALTLSLFFLVDYGDTSKLAPVFLRDAWQLRWVVLCLNLGLGAVHSRGQAEPSAAPGSTPFVETIVPTFETQKLARTYVLDIPAPRGQITDRNGAPFAQNRLSYNLAISYPTPLDFSDAQVLSFAREKIRAAEELLGRALRIPDELIKRHYRNRGILPF